MARKGMGGGPAVMLAVMAPPARAACMAFWAGVRGAAPKLKGLRLRSGSGFGRYSSSGRISIGVTELGDVVAFRAASEDGVGLEFWAEGATDCTPSAGLPIISETSLKTRNTHSTARTPIPIFSTFFRFFMASDKGLRQPAD